MRPCWGRKLFRLPPYSPPSFLCTAVAVRPSDGPSRGGQLPRRGRRRRRGPASGAAGRFGKVRSLSAPLTMTSPSDLPPGRCTTRPPSPATAAWPAGWAWGRARARKTPRRRRSASRPAGPSSSATTSRRAPRRRHQEVQSDKVLEMRFSYGAENNLAPPKSHVWFCCWSQKTTPTSLFC